MILFTYCVLVSFTRFAGRLWRGGAVVIVRDERVTKFPGAELIVLCVAHALFVAFLIAFRGISLNREDGELARRRRFDGLLAGDAHLFLHWADTGMYQQR